MLDVEILKKTIEGYRKANKIIEKERKQRLQSMTVQESLEMYDELCDFYYSQHPLGEDEKLKKLRIEFLLERRRKMNVIAERLKSNE